MRSLKKSDLIRVEKSVFLNLLNLIASITKLRAVEL